MKLRLKDLRLEKGLFQKEVAEYLEVTQQTYSRYELGQAEPSLITIKKLAEFYNTSVDYLMGL